MHLPQLLQERFAEALSSITDSPEDFSGMIRAASDPKFGDYQSNAAMPLGKQLGKPPREVATSLVDALSLGDLFEPPSIAGPGFINLKLNDDFLCQTLASMAKNERVGVGLGDTDRKVVIDFSSPNVAKPMHVGHIRSTVIGDCLSRVCRFLGEQVVTDNHLGDWGTQFGIIIYGYKHFGDADKVAANPVPELSSLYRLTNQLIEYQKAKQSLVSLDEKLQQAKTAAVELQEAAAQASKDEKLSAKEKKKHNKAADSAVKRIGSVEGEIASAKTKIDAVDQDSELSVLATQHADVPDAVLRETAKLHEGDEENLGLWKQFLPHCKDEINRVYQRLNVTFDHTLGESFYHDRLAGVVEKLDQLGLTTKSDGAVCVFLEGFDSPMIIQKRMVPTYMRPPILATLEYRKRNVLTR